jgi:hypothetical protein
MHKKVGSEFVPVVAVLDSSGNVQGAPATDAQITAQVGVKITALSALPTGGTGIVGWLSRIWDLLTTGASSILKPATSGGVTTSKFVSAATTNPLVIKASAGQVYGVQLANNGAGWAYVKLHNVSTAPTAGATAVFDVFGIPPGGSREVCRDLGVAMGTGIAITITGGSVDTDATAVALGQVVGSIHFA